MKPRIHLLAAAALITASAASHGATLQLNSWTYGNGNAVNVVDTAPTPDTSFSGPAGGFSGTLSDAGAGFNGSIETYCVELTQSFNLGTAYANYNLVDSNAYFGSTKAGLAPDGTPLAGKPAATPAPNDDGTTDGPVPPTTAAPPITSYVP